MNMQSETQVCQKCKKDFVIESEDFDFYAKIKVPPPTFCFDCRSQRRMMFRNERTLYKRENSAPGHEGEQMISIFNPEAKMTVYDDRTWWSDAWDPFIYGREYDFFKPFFSQFKELYRAIPQIGLSVTNNVNCTYCNVSEGDKACHMVSASEHNEDTLYSNRAVENRQSGDLYIAFQNELCYEMVSCTKCYRTSFSINSQECSDSQFLSNCKNCSDCLGCINLRNASRCIFNTQYSKEEYEAKKKQYALDTLVGLEKFKKEFGEFCATQFYKYANNIKSEGSTGDNLVGVTRSKNTFDFQEAEDLKNCFWGLRMKDSYDAGPGVGMSGGNLLYEVVDNMSSSTFFSSIIYGSFDARYSINCHGSSHLFGCYGLRNKEYCILNRQYSKEEYEALIPKILEHMDIMPYSDSKGRVYRYGEFFPHDISPFAYNETIAQEYYPLTKEEALEHGFAWYERSERSYQITMTTNAIPESISITPDTIFQEVIECKGKGNSVSGCTHAFKVIPQEIELYKKLNLPIPQYCYNCRHYYRLQQRNPMKLWQRECMCEKNNHDHEGNCQRQFETSYEPNRPEIIFCEFCYQKEVL
jgi:hypothetical protein